MKHLFSLLVVSWLACGANLMATPGLDALQAMAPFLNGAFPATTPGPSGTWAVVEAFPNLTFVDPVRMVKDPTSSSRVYVVCRDGEVWRIPFSETATSAEKVQVLDLRAHTWGRWDTGMLSIAFHPDFGVAGNPNRGYFYVFYQYSPNLGSNYAEATPSYLRLSRFTIPDGQQTADPNSELVMIQQFDGDNWHAGGQMFFGPDRFLHLAVGDEGGSDDYSDVTQTISGRLFSGILRIDVDQNPSRSHPVRRQPAQVPMPNGWANSFTQGYSIPDDNPWLDPAGGVLEEFWTIGLRSPHSMQFDSTTGEIWIAEVGQATREEITVARKGGNHQWPYMEGNAPGPKLKPANLIGSEVPPTFDYPRGMGGCVIGGVVYRGSLHAGALTGKYIFGDHNTRAIYALTRPETGAATADYLTSVYRYGGNKQGLSGICEGPDKELYFTELGENGTDSGKIYRLARAGQPIADPPQFLSQTGAFSNLATLAPSAGVMPYEVNSPLWSDGAEKKRWIAVPNDGTHNTGSEQVTYADTGAWSFPVGTVLVKHFALPVDERNPSITKPLETRFFVHGADGVYYGVTYKWNDAGTDAELLAGGASRDLTITQTDGSTRTQQWDFPSRADCRTCHTEGADNVLGVRSYQLAKDMTYPLTGRRSNQLETWNALGLFGGSFGGRNPLTVPAAVDPRNPHASLDLRVKSYLAANCSHCHQPSGVSANFNASFEIPLASQGIIEGLINRPLHGSTDRVVIPNNFPFSVMHSRMSVVGANQMPPIGKNVVDDKAVAMLTDWIQGMASAEFANVTVNSAPVAANDNFSVTYAAATRLNVLSNDTDANAPLGIHGVSIVTPPSHGTISISGVEKRLIYQNDGSGVTGDSFTYQVTDPQGAASNVATVNLSIPADFATWRANTPGAGSGPTSNGDGDLMPDLLEYALGGLPGDGASPLADSIVLSENGGQISVTVKRPAGFTDLTYELETSADLTTWQTAPAGTAGAGILTFSSLQSRPGLSADVGFARLRIRLAGSAESVTSLPLGWRAVSIGAGSMTVGIPFRETPVFSSSVISSAGSTLGVYGTPRLGTGFKGFVEVISGTYAGHRFEVDSAANGQILLKSTGLRTLSPMPDLTGSRIVVCAYHTLGGTFAKDKFHGSTNPANADQLQFFINDGVNPGQFQLYYLLDARPGNPTWQWRAFLPGGGDQGSRAIAPGEGVFVKRGANVTTARLVLTGQVRANPFAQVLQSGVNLVSSPFPIPLTPRQRGTLDPSSAFVASTNINAADQFQLYQNGAFRVFYLLDHPTQADQWREVISGSPNYNDLPIFSPVEAAFFRRNQASPGYRIPLAWPP
ncbi:MAG: PQQ-dependent sugar dehydrogenase [Luteolibacter sp.]|uniref:PQQ-dependent sugar dehydrogenase n=1 Tax=Luteolibacter sp. TaxID=1962973 RepID=UPI0032654CAD